MSNNCQSGNDEKPTIYEVVNWKEQISNNKFTLLIGGVGSGKNYFFKKLANGEVEGAEDRIVLIITSRRGVVDETLHDKDFVDVFEEYISIHGNVWLSRQDWIEWFFYGGQWLDDELKKDVDKYDRGKVLNKSVVCTPAKIQKLLESVFEKHPDFLRNNPNFLWELFDVIIIDEVHSLLFDASYQDSCFHLLSIIRQFQENKDIKDRNMIFATGTPVPIRDVIKEYCRQVNILNYSDRCKSVKPLKVEFISKVDLMKEIERNYERGEKIIYFYNGKVLFPRTFCAGTKIPPSEVLTLFTKEQSKAELFELDRDAFDAMELATEELAKTNYIAKNHSIVLSSPKYREGSNFKDEDIAYVYVDSHIPTNVIQYAGRVRAGNFVLRIVVDGYQYQKSHEMMLDRATLEKAMLNGINKQYDSLTTIEEKKEYIQAIENPESFNYMFFVRYDYFDDCFKFYDLRERCVDYEEQCIYDWDKCDRKKTNCYNKLIKKWFGDSMKISDYESREALSYKVFTRYRFKANGKEVYKKDKVQRFVDELKQIWDLTTDRPNVYLHKFLPNMSFKRRGSNKDSYVLISNGDS